jgi:hypothetical protein
MNICLNKSVICSLLVVIVVVVTISIEPICYYTTKEVYTHILYSNENAALLATTIYSNDESIG